MSTAPQTIPHGRILRYTFRERIVHWLAAISYVYCLLTGLAFVDLKAFAVDRHPAVSPVEKIANDVAPAAKQVTFSPS